MARTNESLVSIASALNKAALSKGQKKFNTLIKQIEQRRKHLSAWEAVAPVFQKKYVDELMPLLAAFREKQVQMVHRLHSVIDQKGLTKTERGIISDLVTHIAGELLVERDDAELKVIYNWHSQSDYDSEVAAEREEMKSALEAMIGTELGDDLDMNSPEEIIRRAHAKIDEQQAEEVAQNEAQEARRAKRKKSAKQIAAQARQEAEQAELGRSIREVYRKLASALHPDREPDPQERERKTALMQRVNQAYDKNNLLLLLELQLELEHIDQRAINDISEDRLKHYNSILKDQVDELNQEIFDVEARFRDSYGVPPFAEISPDTVVRKITGDIAGFQQDMRDIEKDIRALDDSGKIKSWLKAVKRQLAEDPFNQMPF
jgi:hypothetical protein